MPNPPGYGLSKVLGTPPASADEHALNPADPAVLSAGLPEGSPLHNITPGKSGPTVPASRERESFSSRLLGTPRGTSHAYAGVSGILHSEGPVAMSGRVGMTHLLAHNEIGDSVSKPFGAAASRGLAAQVRSRRPGPCCPPRLFAARCPNARHTMRCRTRSS